MEVIINGKEYVKKMKLKFGTDVYTADCIRKNDLLFITIKKNKEKISEYIYNLEQQIYLYDSTFKAEKRKEEIIKGE